MKTLQVKLPGRSYNIDIGLNILQTQLPNVVLKKNTDLVVIVTNETLHNQLDLTVLHSQEHCE